MDDDVDERCCCDWAHIHTHSRARQSRRRTHTNTEEDSQSNLANSLAGSPQFASINLSHSLSFVRNRRRFVKFASVCQHCTALFSLVNPLALASSRMAHKWKWHLWFCVCVFCVRTAGCYVNVLNVVRGKFGKDMINARRSLAGQTLVASFSFVHRFTFRREHHLGPHIHCMIRPWLHPKQKHFVLAHKENTLLTTMMMMVVFCLL